MKIIANYLTLILLVSTLTYCAPRKQVMTSQRDSVMVELRPRTELIRDTVTINIERIVERAVIATDSSRLENRYATSEAIILPDGRLSHTLESRPQRIAHPIEIETQVRDSIVYRLKELHTTDIQYERLPLTWWQQTQIYGFWIAMLIIVIALAIKRFRR